MTAPEVAWLLDGDAAVRHQTRRDLLDDDDPGLQERIAFDGDARGILAAHAEGEWGHGFYEPKWTCPHYSLLELRDLALPRDHAVCVAEVATALDRHIGGDGGFNPAGSVKQSDVCMNGMLSDAVGILLARRGRGGRWSAARSYPGRTHVAYPPAGEPSRWVTLRALRALRWVGGAQNG